MYMYMQTMRQTTTACNAGTVFSPILIIHSDILPACMGRTGLVVLRLEEAMHVWLYAHAYGYVVTVTGYICGGTDSHDKGITNMVQDHH